MYHIPTQCASGSLFGLAFGDALGAETEFLSVAEILRRFPPYGPQEPQGNPARVTDDTQMALAVGEALLEVAQSGQSFTAATLEGPLRKAFIAWNNSPENTRAPGMTCIRACENLEAGMLWYEATVANSKGCGANMRVAPVGLLPLGKDTETRAAMAQFQAALTYGHPTALAAADLTTYAIAHLAHDGYPEGLPRRLREYAMTQRTVYHTDWLGCSGSVQVTIRRRNLSNAAGMNACRRWAASIRRWKSKIGATIPAWQRALVG
jgi:ADP-ribosylglycohydrolase